MMERLKRRLSGLYRKLFPLRRVLVRVEDRLADVPNRRDIAELATALQALGGRLDRQQGMLQRLDEQIQPLTRLDEVERRLLQRQDEQFLGQNTLLKELRAVGEIAARLGEKVQPLARLDEIERRLLQRQDEQVLAQSALMEELRAVGEIATRLGEKVQPLTRLDEIERRLLQRQDEQVLAQDTLLKAMTDLRMMTTQVEPGLNRIETRLRDTMSNLNTLQRNFVLDMRLHDRQLRTTLTLQEQLMAAQLMTGSPSAGSPGAGPLEIPQIRQILSDHDTEAAHALISDTYVEFLDQKVYFDDLISLYVVFKEIFLYEDYFADLGTETPRILDAGAHIGLATIYLKNLYPGAEITCFEPDPRNFELLERNTTGFGDSVTRLQKAVTPDGRKVRLMRRAGMSMASSIYERSSQIGDQDQITAEATKLSPFLKTPVDLLKLDIEGPEDLVLAECRARIRNVHFLFIEFHTGDGLPLSRLRAILKILDEAGFTYQIERAREYQTRMMHRPFTHLDTPCTHVLHARNPVWPPEASLPAPQGKKRK